MNEKEYVAFEFNPSRNPASESICDSEMAFEFAPSSHTKLTRVAVYCGKTDAKVTVSVRIRADECGTPGHLLREKSRTVTTVSWHDFDMGALRLPRMHRYWLCVVGSTGLERTPVFDVVLDGEALRPVRLDPTGRTMFTAPLAQQGTPVLYYTGQPGNWKGPFSAPLIARIFADAWTREDSVSTDQGE